MLLPRVAWLEGGRAKSTIEQTGEMIGSPLLMISGALERTAYVASVKVELRLVSALDGTTLWFGCGSGSAYNREGTGPAVDTSMKTAITAVLSDLCAARLDMSRVPERHAEPSSGGTHSTE